MGVMKLLNRRRSAETCDQKEDHRPADGLVHGRRGWGSVLGLVEVFRPGVCRRRCCGQEVSVRWEEVATEASARGAAVGTARRPSRYLSAVAPCNGTRPLHKPTWSRLARRCSTVGPGSSDWLPALQCRAFPSRGASTGNRASQRLLIFMRVARLFLCPLASRSSADFRFILCLQPLPLAASPPLACISLHYTGTDTRLPPPRELATPSRIVFGEAP